jgi:hypothetical protein
MSPNTSKSHPVEKHQVNLINAYSSLNPGMACKMESNCLHLCFFSQDLSYWETKWLQVASKIHPNAGFAKTEKKLHMPEFCLSGCTPTLPKNLLSKLLKMLSTAFKT